MALTQGSVVGLTSAEVAQRQAAGQVNVSATPTSRTIGAIVRANVFTRFNAILGGLLVVILVIGPLNDALFGVVLVANAAIGIVQEVRAKRALDALALVHAPRATVWRDGAPIETPVEDVVLDDVLEVVSGDQIVVDGVVVEGDRLEVDESLHSGESDPVPKRDGDEVLSSSFVVAGGGRYRATRVGADAYADQLA
ncbi:MAG: cation-transporting P-type ATPase, partial [Acidimicrobiaceae bacterium]